MENFSYYLLLGFTCRLCPDFEKILPQSGIVCFVSSLHTNELNDSGRLVMPHHHILLKFPKPVSRDYVSVIANIFSLNSVRPVHGNNVKTLMKKYNFVGGSYVKETRKPL